MSANKIRNDVEVIGAPLSEADIIMIGTMGKEARAEQSWFPSWDLSYND
jgi:hypothetical protein